MWSGNGVEEDGDDGAESSSPSTDQDNDIWKIINGAFGLSGSMPNVNAFGLQSANNADLVEAITERVTVSSADRNCLE